MAFAVKLINQQVVEFHRDKPPTSFVDEVVWFQADGDELNTVRSQFENLPITKGNICRWTGETANFVFRNLSLE